ncbi:AraC family transcriptional regulator [Cohnella ginsengisoli]|uniref:AraC family transcriptional regulator n=1 Tax=Cohnella ginsengisoli TaxID=425004 RepID=A0A9X4KKG5_9BACL|nr:AraC family transcriptional regulator [Cohnella ginsengisoli]MDG0793074.1 AraC family transcriptional regulator [Cohnella ginsengisoli]
MQADGWKDLDHLWFKLRKAKRIAKSNAQAGISVSQGRGSYTLLAVTEGRGVLLTDGQAFGVEEGTIYVAEPGASMTLLPDGEATTEFYLFSFDVMRDRSREMADDSPAELQPMPQAGKPLRIPPVSLSAMSRAAYGSMTGQSGLERFRGQFVFQELLHRVFNEWMAEPSDELNIALEHLRTYIEQHYYEPLSVKRLAGLSKISPRHLVQMFKNKYKVEPMEYVRTLRVQRRKAKAMTAGQA